MATRDGYYGWREREESPSWLRLQSSPVAIPPGFEFREARRNKRLRHLIVRIFPTDRRLLFCPDCGADVNKNGLTYPRFVGKPDGQLRVTFMIVRQKYQCKADKKHCPGEPIPGLDPTHRCFATVTEVICAQPDRTNGVLAHSTGYSDKTIAAFFAERAATIAERQYDAVFWGVTMDEKYVGDGVPHFNLGNLLCGQYITMTKDNKEETMREELRKFKHRDKVQLVLMDTAFEYGPIAQDLYPNARIVRDLGHLNRLAHKCRDEARKAALKFTTGKMKALLEKPWELWGLLEEPGGWESIGLPGELIGNEAPSLRKAHDFYKSFLHIYVAAEDSDDALRLFDVWARGVQEDAEMMKYFGILIRTIGDRGGEAFGYLNEGMTNNPAESINRQLEAERNKGRTFNWQGLKNRMACKAEVARQQAVEYLAHIEEELQQSGQDLNQPTALSETAQKRQTRSIRMLAGQPPLPPDEPEAAELSIQAALKRSAEMARRAKRRQTRSKAQPAGPASAQVGSPSATARPEAEDSKSNPSSEPDEQEHSKTPGGFRGRLR